MVSAGDRWALASICLRRFLSQQLGTPVEFERNISGTFPNDSGRSIVFSACDEIYFRQFGVGLIHSARANSAAQRLHMHIYEPSAECLSEMHRMLREEPDHLSFTWDEPGLNPYPPGSPHAPIYYAAVRFIRFRQLVDRSAAPAFAIDCDSIVRGDLTAFFERAGRYDVGVHRTRRRHAWHRQHPWRKVLAGAVFAAPSPAGRRFAAELSLSVHDALARRPDHHVDQLILLYLLRLRRLTLRGTRVLRIPKSLIDWEFDETSLLWSGKGPRKYAGAFQDSVMSTNGKHDPPAVSR